MKELCLTDLEAAQAGDREAAGRLLEENSGLIWSVARRYFGRGAEAEDLYQLGCVGFLKAIEGFDRESGTCFSTYAVPKIAGEIRRFLRDDGTVKVSRGLKERANAIRAARQNLTGRLGREPTISELAAETGLAPEEIASAELASGSAQSLNGQTGEEGFSLEQVLTAGNPEEDMIEHIALMQALERLGERDRLVIELRYFHGLTQERIARIIGVSQVQVSRIEKKALGLLRQYF